MASSNQGNKQSGGTKNRGFASMDPERQREIASQGGKAAHQKGTAHEFTSEEARRAATSSKQPAGGRWRRRPFRASKGPGSTRSPFCFSFTQFAYGMR
jgi:general stress protein YciG